MPLGEEENTREAALTGTATSKSRYHDTQGLQGLGTLAALKIPGLSGTTTRSEKSVGMVDQL